jgi:imidazoleglycerol phosphate synthase glutamine amidotransferase subunit HisH
MYQTTQAKLIEGLNIAIQNKFTILGILVGVQIFLLTFAMLRWVLNLKNFKK